MKIQRAKGGLGGQRAEGAKSSKDTVLGTTSKSFESFLSDSQSKSAREKLAFLMEDIKRQGRLLAERLRLEDLMQYKKTISEFLDISVKEMLEFTKGDYWNRGGQHYIYALVKKVDSSLERLTAEVLGSQKDQITVLHYIDDIRGLLMDLMS